MCPCCDRGMDEKLVKIFTDKIKELSKKDSRLMVDLMKEGENKKTAKSHFQKWRKLVTENMDDILDYRRIANEVNDMEHNCTTLETLLAEKKEDLQAAQVSLDESIAEVDGLRSLLESCKMWQSAADRISNKRSQAMNKSSTLSISESMHNGRDLKTVEKDLAEKTEKKDEYQEKVCDSKSKCSLHEETQLKSCFV